MSFVDKLVRMFMQDQPKEKFRVGRKGRQTVGLEYEVVLKREPEERFNFLPIQNIHLLGSGSKYLLTKDASQKYGISSDMISRLCREKRVICRKNEQNDRLWEVDEESLREYLES